MPRDGQQGPGQQGRIVEGVSADAGPSYTLVVPLFDHASDGTLDSEQPGGLAIEQDAEETRIALLPGELGREDRELVMAEADGPDVGEVNSGTLASSQNTPAVQAEPASSQNETQLAWLNDARDDGAWRVVTVHEMREGGHSCSPEEAVLIARGMALLGTFGAMKGKARSMRRSKTVELAETKHDEKRL